MSEAESSVTVRFAPSPSGRLHVGNVRIPQEAFIAVLSPERGRKQGKGKR